MHKPWVLISYVVLKALKDQFSSCKAIIEANIYLKKSGMPVKFDFIFSQQITSYLANTTLCIMDTAVSMRQNY